MDKQNWRAVWEETRATMVYLEQSLEKVHELERAALIQQQASACSEGVAKTLALMRDGLTRVRQDVHAADLNLRMAQAELDREGEG